MTTIKLIRHLEEDQDFARNGRDGHILASEFYKIPIFSDSIKNTFDATKQKTVRILSSSQNRSKETAQLIIEELNKNGIPVSELESDHRLNPLKHGEYVSAELNEKIDENTQTSKLAQNSYVSEMLQHGNIFYRHGDPVASGNGAKYIDLLGKFRKYGDNQLDFSLRFYSGIIDLIHSCEKNPEILTVLATHNVIISRIIGLQRLGKDNLDKNYNLSEVAGKLYRLEWDAEVMERGDFSYKDFFKQNNYVFDISLEELLKLKPYIESEIRTMVRLEKYADLSGYSIHSIPEKQSANIS